jgi:hypothetical protein
MTSGLRLQRSLGYCEDTAKCQDILTISFDALNLG